MDYQSLNSAIPSTDYSKAAFEQDLKELQPTTLFENLTGAGALSLDYLRTYLNAASGTYAMTLANGTAIGQTKLIYHVGAGGTFNVTGTFQDYTSLQFDTTARYAELVWINSKWVVFGTARAS